MNDDHLVYSLPALQFNMFVHLKVCVDTYTYMYIYLVCFSSQLILTEKISSVVK